jgi:hypothetical protein
MEHHFLKKKNSKPIRPAKIDVTLLGEHFHSIRTTILEIHDFKEKVLKPTPTHQVRKKVDIEEAWPDCQKLFIEIFNELNEIADHFQIESGNFYDNSTFTEAIEAFLNELNTILLGMTDALGTGRYSEKELESIDARILKIQLGATRLQNQITKDFIYSTPPIPRPGKN